MTWLGIDIGQARIGLAMSDTEHTFAYPLKTLLAHNHPEYCIDEIIDLVEEYKIERIIIGLPLLLNGDSGKSVEKINRWRQCLYSTLQDYINNNEINMTVMPDIVMSDERLTTVTAHHALQEVGLRSKQHKMVVDQQAAVYILQSAINIVNRNNID